jgi:S-(hydroxymethyl)glutathione dehydrogenase/alcohol dehydrogenase
VQEGDSVAVFGLGGIGLAVIQGAKLAKAGRIIAIDRVPAKLELARQFGATDVILAGPDTVKEVIELTGGGVHHSFEAIGLKTTAEQAFKMLRRGGTANIIGMIPVGTMIELHGPDFLGEKKIQGSFMGSNRFPVDMPRLVDAYMAGKLKLDELISRRIKLEDVNSAFDELKRGELARSVIVFD